MVWYPILTMLIIGPESDHWLCLSLTNWLTNSLTDCRLVNWIDVKMATQNLLKLLLLLMLMMRIVLATVYCRFGRWGLVIKQIFFRYWSQGLIKIVNMKFKLDFEAGVWFIFCIWCFVEVMKLNLGRDSEARFGQYFEV